MPQTTRSPATGAEAAAAAAAATAGRTVREGETARFDCAWRARRGVLTRTGAAGCGVARQTRPVRVISVGSASGAILHQVRGSPM
ncbi:hypothetical protein ACFFMN_30480 [Planobispora siamensis]|uniref:hypothetical protein n=1 Tax=Planobispora siamensis TaxID=936338 RepID=UPI0035EB1708